MLSSRNTSIISQQTSDNIFINKTSSYYWMPFVKHFLPHFSGLEFFLIKNKYKGKKALKKKSHYVCWRDL